MTIFQKYSTGRGLTRAARASKALESFLRATSRPGGPTFALIRLSETETARHLGIRHGGLAVMWTEYLILAPIVALFALGLFVALRSGPSTSDDLVGQRVRVMAENASAVFFRVVGYLAALLVLQQAIGTPSLLSLGH